MPGNATVMVSMRDPLSDDDVGCRAEYVSLLPPPASACATWLSAHGISNSAREMLLPVDIEALYAPASGERLCGGSSSPCGSESEEPGNASPLTHVLSDAP
jgi:hypothetical protein